MLHSDLDLNDPGINQENIPKTFPPAGGSSRHCLFDIQKSPESIKNTPKYFFPCGGLVTSLTIHDHFTCSVGWNGSGEQNQRKKPHSYCAKLIVFFVSGLRACKPVASAVWGEGKEYVPMMFGMQLGHVFFA